MMMSTANNLAGPDSGPLLGEPVTELPFDPWEIDSLSDAEIDELTHGVIALDSRGRILRYNLAEANLARLDRHSVIGRMFFDEVAPCTKTPAFCGEFEKMVETGADHVPRFAYLLDFKFGAQECDVEMIKAKGASRYYVFVTRRRFADPRSGLPDGWAAPLQAELDPADENSGVVRDTSGARLAMVDSDFLATLVKTAQASHPFDWPRLGYEWGRRWGRRWIVSLEMTSAQDHAASLADLPFSQTMALVAQRLARTGWGNLHVSTEFSRSGVLVAELERSLLGEITATGRAESSPHVHALMEGLLAAIFSHLAGRKLAAVSVRSHDESRGVYLIVAEAFRDVTVAAVSASAAKSLDDVLSVLRATAAVVKP